MDKHELCRCSMCKSTKILETYFSINVKGAYYKTCDSCRKNNKIATKKYVEANKDKVLARQKAYREKNPDTIKNRRDMGKETQKVYMKEYQQTNKEKIKAYKKKYQSEKRHHCCHNTWKKTCQTCSPNGYLNSIIRCRIHDALKAKKSKKSIEYLGCDIATFREHLQKTFKEGMTWENQGKDGWDIDHIIPVLYKQDGVEPSLEEVGKRLHYSNCQAMWHIENMKKGNHYCGDYQSSSNDSDSG